MLTANDLYSQYAAIAGPNIQLDNSGQTCDEQNAATRCGREAIAVDPHLGLFMCRGHLKLAAAMALEIDAWDNDGVRP